MQRSTVYPARPGFIADGHAIAKNNGKQISWGDIPESSEPGGSVVTVGPAGAIATATSVPVLALTQPLADNTVLDFGGGKFARLNGAAAAGAVAITVDALVTALVSLDVAHVEGDPRQPTGSHGYKFVRAGSVMSTLLAGANAGKLILRAARPGGNTDPATCIIETNANEPNPGFGSDALTGYGCLLGAVVYENLLADADPITGLIPSDFKTELDTARARFTYLVYSDNRT